MARKYPHGEVCRYYKDQPNVLVQELPHYHHVEKDPKKHLAWRLDLYKRAAEDKQLQQALLRACAEDFLFFVNFAAWIVEPREVETEDGEERLKILPFNSWCNQDPVMAALAHYFGKRHIVGDKSRAQGASWIMCCLIVWGFLFKKGTIYGIGSKDEETADDQADPGSNGWKIDFLIENLPPWMKPEGYEGEPETWKDRSASKSTWKNRKMRTFIKAFAATKKIARGGRFTVFFLDESAFFPNGDREAFANLVRTTNCLVAISTPHGMDNAHYDYVHKPGPWLKVILDWKDNPDQNRGLYTAKNGQLHFIDKCFDWSANYPEGYEHVLDGRVRSPWYDQECEIHGNDMLFIAQELDREYSGSKGRPFPQDAVDRMGEHVRQPIHTGMLQFDELFPTDFDEIKWVEAAGYKFDVWANLIDGYLPVARYVVGVDLSRGVGGEHSSNSVMSIFNLDTRVQVAELAINTIDPVRFADLAIATCYWLGHGEPTALLNWEREGPGQDFGNEVKRIGYHNVWYPIVGDDLKKYGKRAETPGYSNKNRGKALSYLLNGIVNQTITIRSGALLEECGHYVFGDDGQPMHPRTKTARDGSARGVSHGDRCIAASMAICAIDDRNKAARRRKKRTDLEVPTTVHPDSIAGRIAARTAQKRAVSMESCRW